MGLADLREGGPERVLELLEEVSGGRPVVINAASFADFEVFVLGLLAAEEKGKRLCRTGPSFVRTRGGITEPKILRPEDLYRKSLKRATGSSWSVPTCPRPPASSKECSRLTWYAASRCRCRGSWSLGAGRTSCDEVGSRRHRRSSGFTSRELVTAGKAGALDFRTSRSGRRSQALWST